MASFSLLNSRDIILYKLKKELDGFVRKNMKIIRIIGIVDSVLLIVTGILYFFNIRFSHYVLPLLLLILIICAGLLKDNQKANDSTT